VSICLISPPISQVRRELAVAESAAATVHTQLEAAHAAREAVNAQNEALSAQIADMNGRIADADRQTAAAVAAQSSAQEAARAKDEQVCWLLAQVLANFHGFFFSLSTRMFSNPI
jgi:hypothetical protein